MPASHRLLKYTRLLHLYLGVFIAPALIFFAFTGFVQTFGMHEAARGSSYTPPAILVKLGQLHKKQTLIVPERKPQPTGAASTGRPGGISAPATSTFKADTPAPAPKPDQPGARPKNLLLMKLFFALVSVGLLLSTLTGLYMAYKYVRNAKLITALWVAGIVIPVLLTLV